MATAQCHASRPEAWRDASHEPSGDASLRGSRAAGTHGFRPKNRLRSQSVEAAPRRPQRSMAQNKAWQAFDTSTEAGRMLKKLYGGAAGHPNIAYPKLTTKPRKQMPKFIPGGAKLDATDARSNSHRREKASTVEPWRKKYSRPTYKPIDFVARKRNTAQIDEILEDMSMRNAAYRPPRVNGSSTDAEKARLQEIAQFGGGKALPDEMTLGKTTLPSERRAQALEEARVEREWRKRRGLAEEPAAAVPEPKSLETQQIEQISREIEDRAAFLEEAKAMGLKGEPIKRVEFEISTRKHELEQRM